jgi:CopG family nickel-responsive transcriptional regulator
MKRLTMSLDDELADAFEELVRTRGYENRSEAFRDLLRSDLMAALLRERPQTSCVATLSYVYNHHQRQLAARLTDLQHDHHSLTVSTMHAHLDHDRCIETVILRGRADEVQAFAQSVITQPGVSHGQLQMVPLTEVHKPRTSPVAVTGGRSHKKRGHRHTP